MDDTDARFTSEDGKASTNGFYGNGCGAKFEPIFKKTEKRTHLNNNKKKRTCGNLINLMIIVLVYQ